MPLFLGEEMLDGWMYYANYDLEQKVRKLLKENKIIDAMKLIREVTKWGLFESKKWMEKIRDSELLLQASRKDDIL